MFKQIYKIIIQSRLNDYVLQLKDDQLANSIFSINDPKKQRMIIKFIKNGSIKYPQDMQIIDKAYQIINRKNLDYNKFNSPQQILDQYQQLSNKIQYNPDNQKCFYNKVNLDKGVVVYNVKDDIEGLKAVRRAVDYNWGNNSNPWCLITPPLQDALDYWKTYNAIPKRICFQNNKLIAFCANDFSIIKWWDRNNNQSSDIPIDGVEDDLNAINIIQNLKKIKAKGIQSEKSKQLQQIYQNYKDVYQIRQILSINQNTPSTILQKLYDEDPSIRIYLSKNPNTPSNILQKLSNDENQTIKIRVAAHPKTPIKVLQKLSKDENYRVRWSVASNPNTPINVLYDLSMDEHQEVRRTLITNYNCPIKVIEYLSNDPKQDIRYYVASCSKTPIHILQKLSKDHDWLIKNKAIEKLNKKLKK